MSSPLKLLKNHLDGTHASAVAMKAYADIVNYIQMLENLAEDSLSPTELEYCICGKGPGDGYHKDCLYEGGCGYWKQLITNSGVDIDRFGGSTKAKV
jgi:hypothetical protein